MKYFAIHKPYGFLSQFTDPEGRKTLMDLYQFPKGVYPVGRLDRDSEGLLILTDDKSLTEYLLNPQNRHEREYYVQVEGVPEKEDLDKFKQGIIIGGKKTMPANAIILGDLAIEPRNPPIRVRKNIPDTWLNIILYEGKNRQVRKMTAAIGFPTLRLLRVRIKNIKLGSLPPGGVRELTKAEINKLKE